MECPGNTKLLNFRPTESVGFFPSHTLKQILVFQLSWTGSRSRGFQEAQVGSNERKCCRYGLGTKKLSCQRHSRWGLLVHIKPIWSKRLAEHNERTRVFQKAQIGWNWSSTLCEWPRRVIFCCSVSTKSVGFSIVPADLFSVQFLHEGGKRREEISLQVKNEI